VTRPLYKSSIPAAATERIVERYPNGARKKAEYRLARKLVGMRWFFESGDPEWEFGMKDGKKHGIEYHWFDPGILSSVEPFVDGMMHGTTRQWDQWGRLIGTYRMVRGTGIDLWRMWREDRTPYLSEVMYYKNSRFHGFEWRIEEDQRRVWYERHWRQDVGLHGIEREWNNKGGLSRGYPRYFVGGEKVSKRQYVKAAMSDPTLPPFRLKDNKPARTFPPEIAKHLRL
jgi:antitoxin component YwqK of YwqJK toxin-antitoxin module